MIPENKKARLAGFLYLAMAGFGMFAMMYVEPKFYVQNDAAATLAKIKADEMLFRLGFVSSLLCQITFLFLVNTLYSLFYGVSKDTVRLMLIFVVASVPMACLNMIFQYAPLILISDKVFAGVFSAQQVESLSMLFVDMQKNGVFIAQILWGLWLLPLGLLVIKSGFLPKIIGVLLVIACFGYVVDCFAVFLFPGLKAVSGMWLVESALAEFTFIFWMIFKGIDIKALTKIKEA